MGHESDLKDSKWVILEPLHAFYQTLLGAAGEPRAASAQKSVGRGSINDGHFWLVKGPFMSQRPDVGVERRASAH